MEQQIPPVTQVSLEDLVPETGEFEIKALNKTFRLRPVSALDEIWLKKRFGYGLQDVFDKMKMLELASFAYHQLEEADKVVFKKQKLTIMNEQGEEVVLEIGGEDLMLHYVCGAPEKVAMATALLKTLGISRPVVDKMAMEELKKKAIRKAIAEGILQQEKAQTGQ